MNRLLSTFWALLQASDGLEADAPSQTMLAEIIDSKLVRPANNEILAYWFARYLSIRHGLWDLINECLESGNREANGLNDEQVWSHFVIGYSAACLLIRTDRYFLFDIATHSILQRKFNEEFLEYRIPRKQYTTIFSAFVDGRDTLRIYDAIHDAKKNQAMLEHLCNDPVVGGVAKRIPEFEQWLDYSKRNYAQRLITYISHKLRRKGVVILNNLLSNAVENVGRAASGIQLPLKKRVSREMREHMLSQLEPGDILVTRHDTAFTNLFLPGFWPHAALFVGTEQQRIDWGIEIDADKASRWCGNNCVLEALKDGVRFRPLTETLAVDNFLVLRPNLSADDIRVGIERVVHHEGKLYNFDFDFFSSDRLVCSEVVYRAFDGVGGLTFPLVERAGRHTLSPEDLVDLAINTDSMEVKGIFGVDISRTQYIVGSMAEQIAIKSVTEHETQAYIS